MQPIMKLEREEQKTDRKETRRHTSLDYLSENGVAFVCAVQEHSERAPLNLGSVPAAH